MRPRIFAASLVCAPLVFASHAPGDAALAGEPSTRATVRTVAMQWLNRSGARPVTKFGITLDDNAKPAKNDAVAIAAEKPLVILVHGFNSSPERNAALVEPIRHAGHACGAFRYPNDQPIADSAALLARELAQIAKNQPQRKVTLVAYSMGGLVAREAIENKSLDPGNVAQLIMVGPPSHGSSCARIACSGDLWEHGCNTQHGTLDCLYACLEDGLGEARHDLKPGSAFLTQLNERPRNAAVRYTVFLGTGGKLSPEQLEQLQTTLERSARANSLVKLLQPALQRTIVDLNDAACEGDGIVSVARGRLDGVNDTVLLGFNHWNVIDCPEQPAVKKLHAEILARLAKK